jgi:hypothetical protein
MNVGVLQKPCGGEKTFFDMGLNEKHFDDTVIAPSNCLVETMQNRRYLNVVNEPLLRSAHQGTIFEEQANQRVQQLTRQVDGPAV